MTATYKLTYFPVKAVAEPIRFLMKYGGIEFEDDRFEIGQWSKLKEKMPFGQVPVLTTNDRQYHQSIALARYFGNQVKLVGENDLENMEIDSLVDTINDLRAKIALYHYESDEAIKETRKGPLFSETIPFYLQRLDKIAEENKGYLACKKLTWADMFFVGILDYLNYMTKTNLTEKYSNLEKVKNNVLGLPAIKQWVETRPKSDF